MGGRNNLNTVENLKARAKHISSCVTLSEAQHMHAYQFGWVAALYWADLIDKAVRDALHSEIDAALAAWGSPTGERSGSDPLEGDFDAAPA